MKIRLALILAFALAGAPTAAFATPRVAPGWPVPAPAGVLLPPADARSGPVLVAGASFGDGFTPGEVTVSYSPLGRINWWAGREYGCGNCDSGLLPPRLWPNGVYAPLGVDGDDPWTVDRNGKLGRGCTGAFVGDDCVQVQFQSEVVRVASDGTVLWRLPVAGLGIPEGEAPAPLAIDGTTAYVGVPQGPAVLAIDLATGRERWRVPIVSSAVPRVVSELPGGGALVNAGGNVVALNPDGRERWRLAGGVVGFGFAIGDSSRIGVTRYLDPRGAYGQARFWSVEVLETATGRTVWRRPKSTLLAAGRRGHWYVGDGTSLIALDRRGHTRWRYPSLTTIASALELPNGRVAVSEGADFDEYGMLTVLDSRRRQRLPASPSMRLSRTMLPSSLCKGARPCSLDESRALILGLSLPVASSVTVLVRNAPGTRKPESRPLKFRAPAGRSHARILPFRLAPGRYRVRVRVAQEGRVFVLSRPITFRD
jgi:PQQ-like domain